MVRIDWRLVCKFLLLSLCAAPQDRVLVRCFPIVLYRALRANYHIILQIRSLKCIVLPLVFVNVILSVVDMMTVGKAGSIGWKTISLYLLTTVCAAILGILSTLGIKGLYQQGEFMEDGPAVVQLMCSSEGTYVTEGDDGALSCSAMMDDSMADDMMSPTQFILDDLSGTFVKSSGGPAEVSLSDTVYDGVFRKLITDNITSSFAAGSFAAVVFFAIVMGVALARVVDKRSGQGMAVIVTFLKELIMVNST